jgi:hypothetical protein
LEISTRASSVGFAMPPAIGRSDARGLGDRPAGATGAFSPGDPHDAQLRRNPVQPLAHAFADGVKRAAATVAGATVDIKPNIIPRQIIRQCSPPGRRLKLRRFRSETDIENSFPDVRDIGVDFFQGERQLVGVEPLGTTPELRALELLDVDLEAFDFAVAAFD